MENRNVSELTGKIVNQRTNTNLSQVNIQIDLKENSKAIDILINEGGYSFYNYVDWLGLAKDTNLIVLSSLHHYYYEAEEINNIKTLINLKELNQIKQIKSFLHSSLSFLPHKSNFIGCFVDNKSINGFKKRSSNAIENGIVSRIPFINMLYNIMDAKTNTYMSRVSVTSLLEDHGFKVLDMTNFNELIFFHSQKVRTTYN